MALGPGDQVQVPWRRQLQAVPPGGHVGRWVTPGAVTWRPRLRSRLLPRAPTVEAMGQGGGQSPELEGSRSASPHKSRNRGHRGSFDHSHHGCGVSPRLGQAQSELHVLPSSPNLHNHSNALVTRPSQTRTLRQGGPERLAQSWRWHQGAQPWHC